MRLFFISAAQSSSTSAHCSVGDAASWSYLPPSAFDHTTTDQGLPEGWNNQDCHYVWKTQAYNGDDGYSITFDSPLGCLDDSWTGHTAQGEIRIATVASGYEQQAEGQQTIELTFTEMPGYERHHSGTLVLQ
jgi:hypothetical protein